MKAIGTIVLLVVTAAVAAAAAGGGKLQIGVRHRPEKCVARASKGDNVHVHYV